MSYAASVARAPPRECPAVQGSTWAFNLQHESGDQPRALLHDLTSIVAQLREMQPALKLLTSMLMLTVRSTGGFLK